MSNQSDVYIVIAKHTHAAQNNAWSISVINCYKELCCCSNMFTQINFGKG